MSTVGIDVTADGYVHVGKNEWELLANLAKRCQDGKVQVNGRWIRFADLQRGIQQGMAALEEQVLTVTNPGYDQARDDCAGQMQHRVQATTLSRCDEARIAKALSMNCCREEHLPLPTTMVRNTDDKLEPGSDLDDSQHLPLPSTYRRVEQKQTTPTVNRQCPTCEPHLVMPSTMRKKVS